MLPVFSGRVEQFRAPAVDDRVTVTREHIDDRDLVLAALGDIVGIVGRGARGQQPDVAPAACAGPRAKIRDRSLREDGKVQPVGYVRREPVQPVDQRRAGRAGRSSRAVHEGVHDQRVLAGREEVGEPRLDLGARQREFRRSLGQEIVLLQCTARGKRPAQCRNLLDLRAKLHLGRKQRISGCPVLVGFVRKPFAVKRFHYAGSIYLTYRLNILCVARVQVRTVGSGQVGTHDVEPQQEQGHEQQLAELRLRDARADLRAEIVAGECRERSQSRGNADLARQQPPIGK